MADETKPTTPATPVNLWGWLNNLPPLARNIAIVLITLALSALAVRTGIVIPPPSAETTARISALESRQPSQTQPLVIVVGGSNPTPPVSITGK